MRPATYQPSDFDDVTLGRKLGAGTFGVVHVALLRDGRYVAVKQLDLDPSDPAAQIAASPSSSSAVIDTRNEIIVHRKLDHPNIIRYLHSRVARAAVVTAPDSQDGGDAHHSAPAPKLLVFLEYVTGGSITSIMKTLPHGRLPPSVVRVYSRHMFHGLKYLHDHGVAHRDIKGDNLLVSQDSGVAKLADFDQAKAVAGTLRSSRANTLAGTPFWMSPEVITEEAGYDPFKADIWSAACTVAEMFTGKAPWLPSGSPMAIMYKLANSTGWPDAIPKSRDTLGNDLYDFLDQCFRRSPADRPGCDQLLSHPYLSAEVSM